MKFVRNTDIRTDDTGRAVIQHEALRPPILFFYDEIEKYSQGEIKWHWHFEMEFILVRDNPVEVYVEDRRIVLRKGEGIWINANRCIWFAVWTEYLLPVCLPYFFCRSLSRRGQMWSTKNMFIPGCPIRSCVMYFCWIRFRGIRRRWTS